MSFGTGTVVVCPDAFENVKEVSSAAIFGIPTTFGPTQLSQSSSVSRPVSQFDGLAGAHWGK